MDENEFVGIHMLQRPFLAGLPFSVMAHLLHALSFFLYNSLGLSVPWTRRYCRNMVGCDGPKKKKLNKWLDGNSLEEKQVGWDGLTERCYQCHVELFDGNRIQVQRDADDRKRAALINETL